MKYASASLDDGLVPSARLKLQFGVVSSAKGKPGILGVCLCMWEWEEGGREFSAEFCLSD